MGAPRHDTLSMCASSRLAVPRRSSESARNRLVCLGPAQVQESRARARNLLRPRPHHQARRLCYVSAPPHNGRICCSLLEAT